MDTSNPGPLLLLGGGVLMFIGSLLKWGGDTSGVSTDALGLLGILTLLFGAAIAAVGGIRAFAPQTSLPAEIAGISLDKILVILAVSIFLWTFGMISANNIKIGIHLTWIGAAVAIVGGIMAVRGEPVGGGSSAPTSI